MIVNERVIEKEMTLRGKLEMVFCEQGIEDAKCIDDELNVYSRVLYSQFDSHSLIDINQLSTRNEGMYQD